MRTAYRYSCPVCRTESRRYATEVGARGHADGHRDEFHGGDHPHGESIVPVAGGGLDRSDLRVLALVALLLCAGLVAKLL
ncbi:MULTISPECIES: hypothetical protein [unclassified Streptomyces]|uniref:hypothetical protein n=1 Tax=unclassified Streptomyces TaxID=2593676 RepID=UPI00225997B7|nr:hypothetical protein [Streptomyces sp. NBC_00198]MCX5285931.1 hypothetical protein [Streptomyces sp. NBC_00198]MCX5286240.1 hypothetical protein [Streptomyces sp. NBC_00198]